MIDIYSEKVSTFNYNDEDRKIILVRENEASRFIRKYVYYLIRNVVIETPKNEFTKASSLIDSNKLAGWCWQTTTFLAPFFDDNCRICRGNLYFDKKEYGGYYHSWLEIKLNNKMYVFDPCLNFLCLKEYYDRIFEIDLYGMVSSSKVREELINYLMDSNGDEKYIPGTENINDSFYKTQACVSGIIKNGKILSLRPRYLCNYVNDGVI